MIEIDKILQKANPQTYIEWKKTRIELIKEIHPILLNLPESTIVQIFDTFESRTNKTIQSKNSSEIKKSLLFVSLISYFHRDHYSIKPLFSSLDKFIQNSDIVIVQITSKLLKFLSLESVEGSAVFHRPVQFAKSFIQSKKMISNAAIILKNACQFCQVDSLHLIYQNFNTFVTMAMNEDELLRRTSIKLLQFMFQRTNFSSLTHIIEKIRQYLPINFHKTVPILKVLYKTHPFNFTQDKFDMIFSHINDNQPENDIDELWSLILKMSQNSQYKINTELFLNTLIKHGKIGRLNKFIKVFHKNIRPNRIINFIQQIGNSHSYECCSNQLLTSTKTNQQNKNKICPFIMLKSLLTYYRPEEINIDTTSFTICEHLIECFAIKKDLLSTTILPKYIDALRYLKADYETIKHALMLCRIYPQFFPPDPFEAFEDDILYDSPLNRYIQEELILTAKTYNIPSAAYIIKTSALYNKNKRIRLLALSCLRPTVELAFDTEINQLLLDQSFKIKRNAIPLFSELNKLNPLFISISIQEFANKSIKLLAATKDARFAVKIASVFPALLQYCSDILYQFSEVLILLMLEILDSTITYSIPNDSETFLNNSIIGSSGINLTSFPIPSSPGSSLTHSSIQPNLVFTNTNSHKNSLSSSNNYSIQNNKMLFDDGRQHNDSHSDVHHFSSHANNFFENNNSSSNKNGPILEDRFPNTLRNHINVMNFIAPLYNQNDHSLESEPIKKNLYKILNQKWIDKRDAYLCRGIALIGRVAEPYLSEILNKFCKMFETRKNEELIISLVKSLRILSKSTFHGLNIRLRCPQISVPLSTILSNTQNDKLSLSIIKLFGSAFDSISILRNSINVNSRSKLFDSLTLNNTELVFETIFLHFTKPSLPLFAAMTMIVEGDPIHSTKYIGRIIPMFLSSIHKSSTFRDKLFEYLEIIVSKCKTEVSGHLKSILPTVHHFIDNCACIKFATSLSYYLKTSFILPAKELYIIAISKMNTNNKQYFKALIKFIAFMIYFQSQPFELFFTKVETEIYSGPFLKIISKYITLLVQTNDLVLFQGRLLLFTKRIFDPQLLFTLCVFNNLPPEQLKRRFNVLDEEESNLRHLNSDDKAPQYDYLYYKKFTSADQAFKTKGHYPLSISPPPQQIFSQNSNQRLIGSLTNEPKKFQMRNLQKQESQSQESTEDKSQINLPTQQKNVMQFLKQKKLIHINSIQTQSQLSFRRKWQSQSFNSKPILSYSIYSMLCNYKQYKVNEMKFINIKTYKVKTSSIIPNISPGSSFFQRFSCPKEVNTNKWMQDLFNYLVKRSPSNSIRSCILLISFNDDIIQTLFPAAFLSCWKVASEKDRNHFSDIIKKMIRKKQNIPILLFRVINLCDRALIPINIDYKQIAEASPSHQMSLVFINKTLKENPNDDDAIDFLLNLFLKMGFTSSIRGVFTKYQNRFDKMTAAKWYGCLGDWEKALSIFMDSYENKGSEIYYNPNFINNRNFANVINCFAKLGYYDEIAMYSDEFDKLNNDEKDQVLDAFFMAYINTHDDTKADQIARSFDGQWTPYRLIIAINYYISKGDFEKAQNLTKKAFKMITSERSAFLSGDQTQTMEILNNAQLFVDCQEILKIKKMNSNVIWRTRVKGFIRDSIMWEQIIKLKNTVVPISSNLPFYIKIISALRKGHHFKLIDNYFLRALISTKDPNFFLTVIKIQWARGLKQLAAFNLREFNKFNNGITFEEFSNMEYIPMPFHVLSVITKCNSFTDNMKNALLENYTVSDMKSFFDFIYGSSEDIQEEALMMLHRNYTKDLYLCFEEHRRLFLSDSKQVSKASRLAATYIYRMYDSLEDKRESAQCFLKAILYSPQDYRSWRGWGYANMRLYDFTREMELKEEFDHNKLLNQMLKDTTNVGRNYSFITTFEELDDFDDSNEVEIDTNDYFNYGDQKLNPHMHDFSNIKTQQLKPIQRINHQVDLKRTRKFSQIYQIQPGSFDLFSQQSMQDSIDQSPICEVPPISQHPKPCPDASIDEEFESVNSIGISVEKSLSGSVRVIDPDIIIKTDRYSIFAFNGIKGFLKACKLNPKNSMEYLCQLLTALFSLPSDEIIPETIIEEITSLDTSIKTKAIPQLTAQIAHPNPTIKKIVIEMLNEIGEICFEQVFFALFLYSKLDVTPIPERDSNSVDMDECNTLNKSQNNEDKVKAANEILAKLNLQYPEKFVDANLFANGMIKSAITWFEEWIHAIDNAAKYHKFEDYEKSNAILKKMFDKARIPTCELDNLFLKIFGNQLNDLSNAFKSNSEQLWPKLKVFYNRLKGQVDCLCTIVLSKVSEELSSKKHFAISLPTTQSSSPNETIPLYSEYNDLSSKNIIEDKYSFHHQIECIEPIMDILGTQQKPRIVYVRATNGNRLKYLLKGSEDLRLDERLMQFFALVNTFFLIDRSTREYNAFITRYTAIPLTTSAGLIEWVANADTLHQIVAENRRLRNISLLPEADIVNNLIQTDFISLNALQRFEIFQEVSSQCKANELFDMIWIKAPSPQIWMIRSDRYSISCSLMSIVGYIIGLGDRHPSNIMIQRDTGRVVHIDFGEIFESAVKRKNFPEKVPFRLTRMLINAFPDGGPNGYFKQIAVTVARVLRENIASLMAQLTIFVQEPIFNESTLISKSLLKRVAEKIEGKDDILVEDFSYNSFQCSNNFNNNSSNSFEDEANDENDNIRAEIERHVSSLISVASNPLNYVRHYPGWCPFW